MHILTCEPDNLHYPLHLHVDPILVAELAQGVLLLHGLSLGGCKPLIIQTWGRQSKQVVRIEDCRYSSYVPIVKEAGAFAFASCDWFTGQKLAWWTGSQWQHKEQSQVTPLAT